MQLPLKDGAGGAGRNEGGGDEGEREGTREKKWCWRRESDSETGEETHTTKAMSSEHCFLCLTG